MDIIITQSAGNEVLAKYYFERVKNLLSSIYNLEIRL